MTVSTTRVALSAWLEAVESSNGPLPPELRHACLTLARFMSGDGSAGCFPGTRTLAARIGVHRATVSRWLHQLVQLGWLDRELRRRQFGRLGGHYFPTLPMAHSDAPIPAANGAPERANSGNGASEASLNGASEGKIGARKPEIGAPSVRLTLTESLTEKSAATPSPAAAGSAAPKPEPDPAYLRAEAFALVNAGKTDDEIAAELGVTPQRAARWRELRETISRLTRGARAR
jgi:hypothetical protein